MKKIILTALLGIVFISGCTQIGSLLGIKLGAKEETILTPQQGLGVTSYMLAVNEMLAGTYNYVLMSVRNHAGGANAKNIIISLENVAPFEIRECGTDYDSSHIRSSTCNNFYNDYGMPVKAHKVNQMYPDEEVQFFWNIRSPNPGVLGNMQYDHPIYYTLSYDYSQVVTKTIAGISQEELFKQSQEGPVSITGQLSSSAGEIKLTSKTQEPFVYKEDGGVIGISINFELRNQGEGIPNPGTSVTIVFKKPVDIRDGSDKVTYGDISQFGWTRVSDLSSTDAMKLEFNALSEIYPELSNTQNLLIKSISSDDLSAGPQTINVPIDFDSTLLFEPQKILTFNVYLKYNYLKEGKTQVSVLPIK